MKNISSNVVFITGAASGIGLALAKVFAARGCNIMLADINAEKLRSAEREAQEVTSEVASVVCDVTSLDSVQAAASSTIERFHEVHIVANNAGVPMGGNPGTIPMEDCDG